MLITSVSEIVEELKGETLCILCGAGISLYSGIPLAGELVLEVLKTIGVEDGDRGDFLKVGLTFEEIMEALVDAAGPEHIFKLFEGGPPNRNHVLIAKLAARGVVRTIMTTNFDMLLETALESEGVPHDICYRNDQLVSFSLGSDRLQVIKLHGHVADRESLAITIKRVASQSLVECRSNAVRSALLHPCTTRVIVLGYSFSDRFDITPALSSIQGCPKEFLVVDHRASADVDVYDLKEARYSFLSHFAGRLLVCDTDCFVSALWDVIIGEESPARDACLIDWRQMLAGWHQVAVREHGTAVCQYMAALLLAKAGRYGRAIEYLSEALCCDASINTRAAIYQKIGDNYRDRGDREKALEWLEKALAYACKHKLLMRQGRALCSIGIVLEDQKYHARSVRTLKRALKIAQKVGDRELEGKCHGNIGIAYKNIGSRDKLKKAVRSQEGALLIARELGDKRSEGRTLGNLGIAYSNLGDKSRAIQNYLEALSIAEDLRDLRHMGIWMANAGEDYIGIDQAQASRYLKAAVEIFQELRVEEYVTQLGHLLGTLEQGEAPNPEPQPDRNRATHGPAG